MAVASYAVVTAGLLGLIILTIGPAYEAAHRPVEAVLWGCLAWFAFEWFTRLARAFRAGRGRAYAFSAGGLVDAVALAPPIALAWGADARSAWLFGVFWLFKLVPGIPGLRRLCRGPGRGFAPPGHLPRIARPSGRRAPLTRRPPAGILAARH